MKYVLPRTETLELVRNDITYSIEYMNMPVSTQNVTDQSYAEYDDATTYNTGDYVKIGALGRLFRCAADGTTGIFPLDDKTIWVDYGVLNSLCAFSYDDFINSSTTGTDMVFEIDFSVCDIVTVISKEFQTCLIEVIDDLGQVVSTTTVDGWDIGVLSFADYYYTEKRQNTRFTHRIDELIPGATVRLTFSGYADIVSIVVGQARDMGCTMMGISTAYKSTSKVRVDEYTNYRTIVRYGSAREISVSVLFDNVDYGRMTQIAEDIIDRNIVFIPTDKDIFTEMITFGYIDGMTIPIDSMSKNKTSTKIVSII